MLYRQYHGRAVYDDWQAWRAAHPGRQIVVNDKLFLQCDRKGRAHDVLTTATMDNTRHRRWSNRRT